MTVILGAACFWLLLMAVGVQLRHMSTRREMDAVQERVETSKRENARLAQELERMKQPAWLTLLARTRLNYKRPDETVVFVYKSEKSGTIVQPQPASEELPNWKKWWNWIRGKENPRD